MNRFVCLLYGIGETCANCTCQEEVVFSDGYYETRFSDAVVTRLFDPTTQEE